MINKTIPLLDLHRHLDGNVRVETIFDLAQQFDIPLPADNIEALKPHVQVCLDEPDFASFLKKLDTGVSVLGNLDAVKRIAYENVEDVFNAGIDHAELRFSPYYMAMTHNLPIQEVVAATLDGVKAGLKEFDTSVHLIGIMSRTFGLKACMEELDALLAFKTQLRGIDLAGNESEFPAALFIEHYKKVRDAGLNVTVHAGEVMGAQSVWDAINLLGATRIGHGVRSIEDPLLMRYLAEHQIGIEQCLTSNVQTKTVSSYAAHPVKAFLEQAVLVTINSDDPAASAIDLPYEYNIASKKVGLTEKELFKLQANSLKIAFLTESEKKQLALKVTEKNSIKQTF